MTDTVLNPQTIVVNDAEVSVSNPMPMTTTGTLGANITLSPRTWIVNGVEVSAANPLPVTVV